MIKWIKKIKHAQLENEKEVIRLLKILCKEDKLNNGDEHKSS